jgi:hypothetical protein
VHAWAPCAQADLFQQRLQLLGEGRLVEAMRIGIGGSSATAKAAGKLTGEEGDAAGALALLPRVLMTPCCLAGAK